MRTRKSRRAGNSASLQLLASTDGGASFNNHVETFSLATTTAENTHAWSAGQTDGTVFLLYCPASGVYLYDIAVATAATAEIPLPGMPASLAGTTRLLSGLDPATTYYVEIKAQGRGWETDWSEPLEITTPGSGTIPSITLPDTLPDFPVGIQDTITFGIAGDPRPAVTVKNSSEFGHFTLSTNAWDTTTMTGTCTLAYRPEDLQNNLQRFVVAAANACGTNTASLSLRVVPPPAPQNLTASAVTTDGFDLEWDDIPGTEGYDVQVSADPTFSTTSFDFSDIVFEPASTVTGLAPGTTYYVRVAVSVTADSVWSDTRTVTTAGEQSPEQAFSQWLADRFGTTSNTPAFLPDADADSDGMTTWEEFLADTCPTDSSSRLKLELKSPLTSTQAVFRFLPSTSRWYQLVWWTNLLSTNSVLNLGRPETTNEILIETNLPPTWFGSIQSFLGDPQGE